MNEKQSAAGSRADAYRLLAACYYPPTSALLEENCCAALAELLSVLAPEAAAHATEAGQVSTGQAPEALAVEHARLFLGPFQLVAPPYGSYYLEDRTVMGESTAAAADFYRNCGLHLADDFHELPDHIAVELEFMSYLASAQRQVEGKGYHDGTDRLAGLQLEFLDQFLLPWLEPFTAAVINDGEAPFYQALARCTAAFVTGDRAALAAAAHG